MQMKRTVLVLLSFALALGAGVAAQRPPAWAPQADAIFADVADPGAAGCAMAVYRDGRIAYERGYGIADLEHDVPITPASVFYVGSLSKQFTAFAVALAASEGKLSIDDDVRKWLPELPDYGTRLDVGHLLHHTSGLRDYNTLFDIAGRRNDEAFDNQIVLGIIARQRALNFPPGEQYLYSNSGYVLLSHIVERATGTPLAAYAKTRMFEPLGMRDTQFYDDVTRAVKNRAFAYERTVAGGVRDNTPHSQRTGAGGVLTTVRDLLAWDNNFYEPKVGTKALIAAMQQPGALKSGKPLTYAYGLQIVGNRATPKRRSTSQSDTDAWRVPPAFLRRSARTTSAKSRRGCNSAGPEYSSSSPRSPSRPGCARMLPQRPSVRPASGPRFVRGRTLPLRDFLLLTGQGGLAFLALHARSRVDSEHEQPIHRHLQNSGDALREDERRLAFAQNHPVMDSCVYLDHAHIKRPTL